MKVAILLLFFTISHMTFAEETQKELCQHHLEMGAKIEAVISLATEFRNANAKDLTIHAVTWLEYAAHGYNAIGHFCPAVTKVTLPALSGNQCEQFRALYGHYEKINQDAKDLVDLEEKWGRKLTSSHARSVEEATLHTENDLYARCSF
jgi:hypothetical protein